MAPSAVAVGGERQRALDDACLRILDAHHCCIARAGARQSVRAHGSVVLFGDPALGGNRGRCEQLHEIRREIRAFGSECEPILFRFDARRGRGDAAIVNGPFFGERMRGDFRGDSAVVVDAGDATFGDLADDDGVETPLLENGKHFVLAALFGDQQHALLRFAEHDFVGRHTSFALRDFGEIDFDAGAATRSHFHSGAGEAGGAHVLNRDNCASLHGFEAGLKQKFLHEGIADLHVRALLLGLFGELRGGEE